MMRKYAILILGIFIVFVYFVRRAEVQSQLKAGNAGVIHKRPNIILITIDTLRADYLGCYGNKDISTPNIDVLARDGVRFKSTVCQIPLTGPSHISILTSLYPHTHGFRGNGLEPPEYSNVTIMQILRDSAYKTAAFVSVDFLGDDSLKIGKWLDTYDWPKEENARAFKERTAEIMTEKAMNWINKNIHDKFFLWVHYYDPHAPYSPPAPYNTMYDNVYSGPADGSQGFLDKMCMRQVKPEEADLKHTKALYKGEVTYVDAWIGRFMDFLKKNALYDDAIIILTSDHGEAFGEHDSYFGHELQLYDPSIKIPLIVKSNKNISANTVIANQVESIDIAPTILELVKLSIPRQMEGRSLLPLIKGENLDYPQTAFSEAFDLFDSGHILRHGQLDNLTDESARQEILSRQCGRSLRTPEWKLITAWEGSGKLDELYNLKDDPGENNNLIEKNKTVTDKLRREMRDWESGNKEPAVAPARPVNKEVLENLKSLGYIH